jgi:hypothetical protein
VLSMHALCDVYTVRIVRMCCVFAYPYTNSAYRSALGVVFCAVCTVPPCCGKHRVECCASCERETCAATLRYAFLYMKSINLCNARFPTVA